MESNYGDPENGKLIEKGPQRRSYWSVMKHENIHEETPYSEPIHPLFTPAFQKVTDLIAYYMYALNIPQPTAKKAALFTVNQILNANPHGNPLNSSGESTMEFWLEVKKEIENM